MKIEIRKFDRDGPHEPAWMTLTLANLSYAVTEGAFMEEADWLEFGRALQTFPDSPEHTVSFVNGAPKPGMLSTLSYEPMSTTMPDTPRCAFGWITTRRNHTRRRSVSAFW